MENRNMRSLDIGMLRVFMALVREQSVSRAAARLFLSQPAVSGTLKRLRETFGDPLFTRTPFGVQPTQRAIQLAPQVEAAVAQIERLLDTNRPFDVAESDRILRIAGSDFACRRVLSRLTPALAECGSRIRLFWEIAEFNTLPERLQRAHVDLGFLPKMSGQPVGPEFELLYEDDWVALARADHPGLKGGMSIDSYCAQRHLVLAQGRSELDDAIDQALVKLGRSWFIHAAVPGFDAMAELIATSDLIGIFPGRIAKHYASRLDSYPLPFELPHYRMFVCWSSKVIGDPAVRWLKDQIVASERRS